MTTIDFMIPILIIAMALIVWASNKWSNHHYDKQIYDIFGDPDVTEKHWRD